MEEKKEDILKNLKRVKAISDGMSEFISKVNELKSGMSEINKRVNAKERKIKADAEERAKREKLEAKGLPPRRRLPKKSAKPQKKAKRPKKRNSRSPRTFLP